MMIAVIKMLQTRIRQKLFGHSQETFPNLLTALDHDKPMLPMATMISFTPVSTWNTVIQVLYLLLIIVFNGFVSSAYQYQWYLFHKIHYYIPEDKQHKLYISTASRPTSVCQILLPACHQHKQFHYSESASSSCKKCCLVRPSHVCTCLQA